MYLLSSETHEEMQQWVGMLQTLKHSRERSLKTPQRSMNLSVGDRPVSTLTTTQSSPPSQDPPPGYKAVKHRSHSHFDSVTSMTLKLPRTSLHEDSSRKRVFSAAKTVPYSVNLTATDEEDEGRATLILLQYTCTRAILAKIAASIFDQPKLTLYNYTVYLIYWHFICAKLTSKMLKKYWTNCIPSIYCWLEKLHIHVHVHVLQLKISQNNDPSIECTVHGSLN